MAPPKIESMHFLMRKLAFLICLFTLAACGQPAPAEQAPATEAPAEGSVLLGSTQNMPDWLLVLRTTEGGTIHFNQRTITRQNGLADIWLQVRYGHTQAWDASDENTERTIRYDVERMHYQFNCGEETFVIVERQIMGGNDEIVARDSPAQVFRATPTTGVARQILPLACRGA
ncbi:MAG: surface-adhesin E family protein [Terricaulis sp.]